MEHYSFNYNAENGDQITVSFTTEHTVVSETFKDMCKRAALAIGYAESTVENTFGPTEDDCFFGGIDD